MTDFLEELVDEAKPGDVVAETVISDTPGEVARHGDSGVYFGARTTAFPSVLDKEDDSAFAERQLRWMKRSWQDEADRLAATGDLSGASFKRAEAESMVDTYRELLSDGVGTREAVTGIQTVGQAFRTYANARDNIHCLRRYAEARGENLVSAAREMSEFYDSYNKHYLQRKGYQDGAKVDPAVRDMVMGGFSRTMAAMKAVEDKYDWRFDGNTYADVVARVAGFAADLDNAGVSLDSVGPGEVVRSALLSNGALRDGDPSSNVASRLLNLQHSDLTRVSLFGPEDGPRDTLENPFRSMALVPSKKGEPVPDGSADFGLTRDIRRALFAHRARNVSRGLDPGDIGDTQVLRGTLVDAFRNASTSPSAVSDETFGELADLVIGSVFSRPDMDVAVIPLARTLSLATRDTAQAGALRRWVGSLVLPSTEGQYRLNAMVMPVVTKFAATHGFTMNDPIVKQLAVGVTKIVRRSFLDNTTAFGLEGLDPDDPKVFDEISRKVETELAGLVGQSGILAKTQESINKARATRIKADTMAREDAKE